MQFDQLLPDVVVCGPLFPEAVQVILVTSLGADMKLIGTGVESGRTHQTVLTLSQIETLTLVAQPGGETFDGDAHTFALGVEAMRLGLAHEYDPYFALSVARVDPLPHQLEAVYDYFLKAPRIRFLLADDPGAGKTIMAGLLLKELKIRGLVTRTLIVAPASLSFQWQREMKEKFRENFEIVRGDVLRANYGSNPFQEKNQVITSVSWASVVEDARESLLRSQWDLIIVDEAHRMSAYSSDKKTYAFQLGEALSQRTDHLLLMTATPHKGDPKQFRLFLELLDKDVYGDISSLEEAMKRQEAPFYLRRTKEALISFPDADGKAKKIFTNRRVETIGFQIDDEEWDFYAALTRYVEDQSIKAAQDDSIRGRALGFTMAMLQRRFASSLCAVRRSLERMRLKREAILRDPEEHRQAQISKSLPNDYDELAEDERQRVIDTLENIVASVNPRDLRAEIATLTDLIESSQALEAREIESKLARLKEVLRTQGLFDDPQMKLLIFTEHRDTLDYLVLKLREWGLSVTQIHGGMKVGDRDTPGTRIYAECEFRESCQIMVATEAAGEGINLQFCWFAINYDIPWNPIRLEQRMGRIHRYGQEKDCLIFNFVSTNTREGRVLSKLFERITQIERDLDPERTGKVFNVLGDVFPANELERMIREMYAHNRTEASITDRIVEQVDIEHFRRITHSTLEGLAKRELNLSSILGKTAEARERRLVPEVIERFWLRAAPLIGIMPVALAKATRDAGEKAYRVGKVPRALWARGERLEPRFGALGREYKQIAFSSKMAGTNSATEWVTPGHPLFETVREEIESLAQSDLGRGAVFYDLHAATPTRLDVFAASIVDGRGQTLHRRIFAVGVESDKTLSIRQPTLFLDLVVAPMGTAVPSSQSLPNGKATETALIEQALHPLLADVTAQRERENQTVARHIRLSLHSIIDNVQNQYGNLAEQKENGSTETGLDGRLKMMEDKLDELNARLERREAELERERQCAIGDIKLIGCAWVLPHPERQSPALAPMVSDPEIERIAVEVATAHARARGCAVQSVESENRGFDLISSRSAQSEGALSVTIETRFIEVKGRAGVGEVALSSNEFRTAERLGEDYWLYVVFNCATQPELHIYRDPARLGWKPVSRVEHYHLDAAQLLKAESQAD